MTSPRTAPSRPRTWRSSVSSVPGAARSSASNVADLVHDDDRDAWTTAPGRLRRPSELVLAAHLGLHRSGGYRWLEGSALPIFTASGGARRRPVAARRHRAGGDAAAADRPRRPRRPDRVAEPAAASLRSAEVQLKVARRRETPLVLLFIDVDGLKAVDDWRTVTRPAISCSSTPPTSWHEYVPRAPTSSRVSAATSSACCSRRARTEAWLAVRRLLVAMEAHYEQAAGERPFRLSLSIGSATFEPENRGTIEQLMKQADDAMYANKREARSAADGRQPLGIGDREFDEPVRATDEEDWLAPGSPRSPSRASHARFPRSTPGRGPRRARRARGLRRGSAARASNDSRSGAAPAARWRATRRQAGSSTDNAMSAPNDPQPVRIRGHRPGSSASERRRRRARRPLAPTPPRRPCSPRRPGS